jgi:hypothetical protein
MHHNNVATTNISAIDIAHLFMLELDGAANCGLCHQYSHLSTEKCSYQNLTDAYLALINRME